jgi:hypothetical protein
MYLLIFHLCCVNKFTLCLKVFCVNVQKKAEDAAMGLKSSPQKHSAEFGSRVITTVVCVLDQKLKHCHCLLTQEKLERAGAQLQHLPYKTLYNKITDTVTLKMQFYVLCSLVIQ